MKNNIITSIILTWLISGLFYAQHISEFNSLTQGVQDTDFHLPSTHYFQYIIEHGDALTQGGILPDVCDFAGYVPINSSSKFGYLSINSESAPGAVTILDIELNESIGKWVVNNSEAVDFSFGLPFGGTAANCSGTVTPWNTIISCEEVTNKDIKDQYPALPESSLKIDGDLNGYDGYGWAIEIDPETKKVIDQDGGRNGSDKLWALGNFKHENVVIHNNKRTVYQGADDTKGEGFLFKFVADIQENLSSGDLYVYKGNKQGVGSWLQLENNTPIQQSSTLAQCIAIEATSFGGIEDVEINPIDGMIYFAVKREDLGGGNIKGVIYRFTDSDALDDTGITDLEIYVGDQSYDGVAWGDGNDNLVFDDKGNLWVAQDESGNDKRNYIWVVENGHSQQNPKVKIFARTPMGSEPTGLTFSPDYKTLFMSVQHPDENNNITNQPDGFGDPKTFDKDVVLAITRTVSLSNDLIAGVENSFTISNSYDVFNINSSKVVTKIKVFDMLGRLLIQDNPNKKSFKLNTETIKDGTVLIIQSTLINYSIIHKKIIKY